MVSICKECGCTCKKCETIDHEIQLHEEIESLNQKLKERDNYITRMENNFLNDSTVDSDVMILLKEDLHTWQDKYRRLSDAHKRVQRVNQGLEDKLLKLVDSCETDKNALAKDVAILSEKLAEANYTIKKLTESNERYKNDVNVAIQFLQCKQSNYVTHKFDSLPTSIQNELSVHMTHKKKVEDRRMIEPKSIKVPIPTFPPTAMVYSLPKSPNMTRKMEEEPLSAVQPVDVVSAAIVARILEERQKERMYIKHCDTCTCSKNMSITDPCKYHIAQTQTDDSNFFCNNCYNSFQGNSQSSKLVRNTLNPKVPNFELESYTNIVKVQPNNFLVEKNPNNINLIDLDINLNTNNLNEEINPIGKINNILPQISSDKAEERFTIIHEVPSSKSKNMIPLPSLNYYEKINQTSSSKTNITHVHKNVEHEMININVNQTTFNTQQIKITKDRIECDDKIENIDKEIGIIDSLKYQEMEENVKKFLFKKTELWKDQTGYNSKDESSSKEQQSLSHTQTDI